MQLERMHSLLKRQLKRFFGDSFEVPNEWIGFIGMVNIAYHESDMDRNMLERSLELSSEELLQANSEMRAIFEAVPDIFFRIDSSGTILDCRTGSNSDFVIFNKVMIGSKIYDISLNPAGTKFRNVLEEVRRTNTMVSFEYSLLLQDMKNFCEARVIPLLENQYIIIVRNITARKNAQSALKISEEIYTRLVNAIPDVIIHTDLTGNISFVNDHALGISGYSRKDIEGRNISKLISAECPDSLQYGLNGHEGRTGQVECQLITKDRRKIPVEINGDVLRNEDGTPFGLVHVCRDITERKRAEKKLRESEEYFREITMNSSDVLFIVDAGGAISYVSPSVERFVGYRPDELIGKTGFDLIIPEDHPKALEDFGMALRTKEVSIPNSFRIRHKNGTELIMEGVGKNLLHNPVIAGFVMNVRDVTDRARAQRELKDSQTKLQAIFDQIDTGIMIIDSATQTIVEANRKAIEMTGFSKERIIGHICHDFVCSSEIGKCPVRDLGQIIDQSECKLLQAAGWQKDILKTVYPILIKGRQYFLESFIDISDRKRAEEALQKAHAELENRVAERTHELTVANADLKELLQKQNVNIDLAKNILTMINSRPCRHTSLQNDIDLFFTTHYIPCYAEGGDHFFIRNFSKNHSGIRKTAVSLKDQSGHEVSCILRSIITDLIHNTLMLSTQDLPLEETITRLNQAICKLPFFGEDNFLTAVNAEINHENIKMRYVSAGHPPFLFIRDQEVVCLPSLDGQGRNLPIGIKQAVDFIGGEIQLQKGDKIIFFTDGLTDMPHTLGKPVLNADDLKDIATSIVQNQPGIHISLLMARLFNYINGQEADNILIPRSFDDDITLLGLELEDANYEYEDIVNPENLDDFELCVNKLFHKINAERERKGFSPSGTRLRMVLEEAMANAWKHGNRQDQQKKIIVRRRYGNDAVLEVIDEGDGFDFRTVYDPTYGENLLNLQGRGNFIMHLFTEETQWKDEGKHLILYFPRED